MSTPTLPLCTGCLRPWTSSRYRTCENCRAQRRAHHQRQRQRHFSVRSDHPAVPAPLAPPLPNSPRQPAPSNGWVCTHCLRPWYSPRYRTCDNCRDLDRRRYTQQVRVTTTNLLSFAPPFSVSIDLFFPVLLIIRDFYSASRTRAGGSSSICPRPPSPQDNECNLVATVVRITRYPFPARMVQVMCPLHRPSSLEGEDWLVL